MGQVRRERTGRHLGIVCGLALVISACGGGEIEVVEPDELRNPTYELFISEAAQAALDEDIEADVEVFAEFVVEGQTYPISLEYQGRAGRRWPKKNFKLKFNLGVQYDGDPFGSAQVLNRDGDLVAAEGPYDQLILKGMYLDEAVMREALAFEFERAFGHPAPLVSFVNLQINGEYWGLYAVVEPVRPSFFARRGFPLGGTLYKAVDQRADFNPGIPLGDGFELKSDSDPGSARLNDLARRLRETPLTPEDYYTEVDPHLPMARLYDRAIWNSMTQNTDGVLHNYYLYRWDFSEGGEPWMMVAWDSDVCLANHWEVDAPTFEVDWWHMVDGRNFFMKRIVGVDGLRSEYVDRFQERLDTISPAVTKAWAMRLFDIVRDDLARDQQRWDRPTAPDDEFAEIDHFLEARPEFLRGLLEPFRATGDLPVD